VGLSSVAVDSGHPSDSCRDIEVIWTFNVCELDKAPPQLQTPLSSAQCVAMKKPLFVATWWR